MSAFLYFLSFPFLLFLIIFISSELSFLSFSGHIHRYLIFIYNICCFLFSNLLFLICLSFLFFILYSISTPKIDNLSAVLRYNDIYSKIRHNNLYFKVQRHNVYSKIRHDYVYSKIRHNNVFSQTQRNNLYPKIPYNNMYSKGRHSKSHVVMVKALNCRIVVCEFELQSRYYVHFRTNTLGKGSNPLILPAMR